VSHQILTRAERIRLFLREYYIGNNTWTNAMRIFGGPLIIGSGIHLYHEPSRFAIGYGGFCFLFGIYYILKPVLIIAMRLSLFQDIKFNAFITENELTLEDGDSKSTIQLQSFQRILRQTDYYGLKLPGKMTIHLKAVLLTEQEKALLDKFLTS
jgi:hypothetical protein